MRYVRIKDLCPGDITAAGLYDNKNRLMLASNMELTETIIQKLENFNFHGIYILHNYSDKSYESLLDDETRKNAIDSLIGLDLDQIRYVANSIVNQVLYDMMTVSSYDMLTYNHSINVTVLSVMMGVEMGLSNAELLELGQAALFHDIGKTRVDPAIIKKNGKLTPEERLAVEKHPAYGYDMLDGDLVSEPVRLSVRAHHENENGTGYPDRLPGNKIPGYAKIIHVADVYDAMVSKRSYKDRLNPADVLEHIGTYMRRNIERCLETYTNVWKHKTMCRKCIAIYKTLLNIYLTNAALMCYTIPIIGGGVHGNNRYPHR